MKKLMFIAAVVAAGLTQAASLDWAILAKSFTMSDDSKPNGATVYVFDTAADGYTAFITSLTGGELGDSINADTFTGASGYLGSGTTYASTKAAQLNVNYGKANGTVTVDKVQDYDLAMIVVDGSDFLVSGTASGKSYLSNPDDGSAASFSAAKMGAGSWATYTPASTPDPGPGPGPGPNIPEPTSGLLLLVGGAMLALRRKQK